MSERKRKKPKKKFEETKVGKFLKGTGSDILNVVGDILPDNGWMGIVKNLIIKDEVLTAEQRTTALKLLDVDIEEMKSVSARWASDMASDSYLSKNVRPAMLIFLTVMTALFIATDSFDNGFVIDHAWIDLLKTLLITVYFAYFGSRGFEKAQTIIGNYKQRL